MTERKYVLTKIAPGDYLLPSNDGATLWRISSYREDGSLVEYEPGDRHGSGPGKRVVGTFWQTAHRPFPGEEFDDDYSVERFLDWEGWTTSAVGFGSRRAAIEDALSTR